MSCGSDDLLLLFAVCEKKKKISPIIQNVSDPVMEA